MDAPNEPLNLSIKKRPVAVVPPSAAISTPSPPPPMQPPAPSSTSRPVAVAAASFSTAPSTTADTMTPSSTDAGCPTTTTTTTAVPPFASAELSKLHFHYPHLSHSIANDRPHPQLASPPVWRLVDTAAAPNGSQPPAVTAGEVSTVEHGGRPALPAPLHSGDQAADDTGAERPTPLAPPAASSSPQTVQAAHSAAVAAAALHFQSQTLATYFAQQQSLDNAKQHLERYLRLTNQYLQSTAETYMTPNETINQLIRTNILTNKMAANNLISIINKLLEQNIMSEYYYKHATTMAAAVAAAEAAAAAATAADSAATAADAEAAVYVKPQPVASEATASSQPTASLLTGSDTAAVKEPPCEPSRSAAPAGVHTHRRRPGRPKTVASTAAAATDAGERRALSCSSNGTDDTTTDTTAKSMDRWDSEAPASEEAQLYHRCAVPQKAEPADAGPDGPAASDEHRPAVQPAGYQSDEMSVAHAVDVETEAAGEAAGELVDDEADNDDEDDEDDGTYLYRAFSTAVNQQQQQNNAMQAAASAAATLAAATACGPGDLAERQQLVQPQSSASSASSHRLRSLVVGVVVCVCVQE